MLSSLSNQIAAALGHDSGILCRDYLHCTEQPSKITWSNSFYLSLGIIQFFSLCTFLCPSDSRPQASDTKRRIIFSCCFPSYLEMPAVSCINSHFTISPGFCAIIDATAHRLPPPELSALPGRQSQAWCRSRLTFFSPLKVFDNLILKLEPLPFFPNPNSVF